MYKRIVVCADGTWNRPEKNPNQDFPTNVLRLARAVQPIGSDQVPQQVFYDWGVGSYYGTLIGGTTGIPISFLGLFDDKDEFYDTKIGKNISIARHAMAIDEHRKDFEPTIWQTRRNMDLKQVWFTGAHADIGGSYPRDKYLFINQLNSDGIKPRVTGLKT